MKTLMFTILVTSQLRNLVIVIIYVIIISATGHFEEKNDKKYLVLDSTDKYEEVLSGIRSEIKTLNGEKKLFYIKKKAKIGINTDDDLPLNKPLKFLTLTIITRCVLQGSEKLYPQIYLGQTNLIFRFAGKIWKKVCAGGRNKNKNIMNFYESKLKFWKFFNGFCDDILACLP